jgi:phosphoglycolate phosphatase-like HAD superfamily hydrolase
MAIVARHSGAVRAVIFDLDETLLVREGAWCYAVEEAIASVAGVRVDASRLAAEYRHRPWHHALSVLLDDRRLIARIALLCGDLYARSAMKRLLVHDGIGMALDRLRGDRIQIGAITHEPHGLAIKQIESTGLDRFLTVLAPTPAGAAWDVAARLDDSVRYLGTAPEGTVFIGSEDRDLDVAGRTGLVVHRAGWATAARGGVWTTIETPAGLDRLLAPR